MNAAAWMSNLSTAGREEDAPAYVVAVKNGSRITVDRWIDGQWVEVTLAWDGEKYRAEGPK